MNEATERLPEVPAPPHSTLFAGSVLTSMMNCVDCCYMPRTHFNFRGINGVKFDACSRTREKILRSLESARVSSTLNVGSRYKESSIFGKMSPSVASNQRQRS